MFSFSTGASSSLLTNTSTFVLPPEYEDKTETEIPVEVSKQTPSIDTSDSDTNPVYTLFDREGIYGYQINLSLLEPWGKLSLAFTSQFKEAALHEIKLDLSEETLSKLFTFFKDWSVDQEKAWNKLQESIFKGDLSEIIEQLAEIDTLADCYFIPELRNFVYSTILDKKFLNHIDIQTIKKLEEYIPENNETVLLEFSVCRLAWFGLVNYHSYKNNFEKIDILFKKIKIQELTDWMKETWPIKFVDRYFKTILAAEDENIENNKINFDLRFEHAMSILKGYFPNYFHQSNCSPNQAFFIYLLMTIVSKVDTAEQTKKIFASISELLPPDKKDHLIISEKEKEELIQHGFSEANYFNTTSSFLLTLAFEQILYNFFIQNKYEEIEKLIEIWFENIKPIPSVTTLLHEIFERCYLKKYKHQKLFNNFTQHINAINSYFKIRDSLQKMFGISKKEASLDSFDLYPNQYQPYEMLESDIEPLLSLLKKLEDEEFFCIKDLLDNISRSQAPIELKKIIFDHYPPLKDTSANYGKILELWNSKLHLESMSLLRKQVSLPFNRFVGLKHLVHEFCKNCGYDEAIKFSSTLNEKEKDAWINKISKYIVNINKDQIPQFLESLKKCANPFALFKALSKFGLKISDENEYIEFLNFYNDYIKNVYETSRLAIKKPKKTLFEKIITNSFRFTDQRIYHCVKKLVESLELIFGEIPGIITSSISAIDLLQLKNEGSVYQELTCHLKTPTMTILKLEKIAKIIDVIENSSISTFKIILQIATEKLLQTQDILQIEYNGQLITTFDKINKKLIKKCWEFFQDSSFKSERELLLDLLPKLKNISINVDNLRDKASFMLFLLTSDISHIKDIENLTKLCAVLGKQNNIKLLNKIIKSESNFPDNFKRKIELIYSYLIEQNQPKENALDIIDYFSNTSLSFTQSLVISFLNPQIFTKEISKKAETKIDNDNLNIKKNKKTNKIKINQIQLIKNFNN